jgi:RNA polymerase sigma factor (sigma-70 family)
MTETSSGAEGTTPLPVASGLEASLVLLSRARAGDEDALNTLAARWLPRLRRWASGRLPRWARDLADTQDLVQETVFQVFRGIAKFEVQAYLRQAVMNRIRMEIRRVDRRPVADALGAGLTSTEPSPLELAVGSEAVARYEAALARLAPIDREAIIGRIEMGLTNADLADALGKPSPNAARMAVERALVRLATEMRR